MVQPREVAWACRWLWTRAPRAAEAEFPAVSGVVVRGGFCGLVKMGWADWVVWLGET